jgi:hypothetical protein
VSVSNTEKFFYQTLCHGTQKCGQPNGLKKAIENSNSPAYCEEFEFCGFVAMETAFG